MRKTLKNMVAGVVGFLIGSVVNMTIVTVGPIIIPPPEGVDLSDMDRFAENLKLLKPVNFIAPWLAHAVGTLAAAFVAATLAASHPTKLAMGMGAFFLLGGIMMVAMYGGPPWFAATDLLTAYLPMAYLGGRLARKRVS